MKQQTGCLSVHLHDDRCAFSVAGIETRAIEGNSEGEARLYGFVDTFPSGRVQISGLKMIGFPLTCYHCRLFIVQHNIVCG